MPETVLYTGVGARLKRFTVDSAEATLTGHEIVELPAVVQYAWAHPSGRHLYVVSSNGGPGKGPGDIHVASAFAVDPHTGALTPHGLRRELPSRPIHCCVDADGRFLLTVSNAPSGLIVHRIESDGSLGGPVKQPGGLDCGVYAHQVRVTPSNRSAILVARGNDAEPDAAEDPGALRVFALDDGALSSIQVVAPGGGLGFRPRHLDFHPSRPWVYVLLESQSELQVYTVNNDGTLAPEPSFSVSTLADSGSLEPGQNAGAIHVHPSGGYVYVTNRNSEVDLVDGVEVLRGGVNGIAAFAIDGETGEPVPLDHTEGHSIHARTFSIHPEGRLLVTASTAPAAARGEGRVTTVPARLVVYRILAEGRLDLARSYDVDTGGDMQFWSGMVTLLG